MGPDVRENLCAHYDAREMQHRAARPLGERRSRALTAFLEQLRVRGLRSVLEIGCGAGRDGMLIARAGFDYAGMDLSTAAVQHCTGRGLHALEADATSLPFAAASFDAAWSMSTLMHLPGEDLASALAEISRVVRPGGLVEIGVWGHTQNREWTGDDGRYFRHRTDGDLRAELTCLGTVVDFDTWEWMDDGGHYQWVRAVVP
ncbi:class I SAM-dependent methyltransferase [Serinicoccus kebangsaanensis]|uniref:class I SAM-dependent methyltransferase n=1 Tax=Serinicoccus kebangsaanensis TaxID=2602069 RepID=UPI00124E03DF|nr:class I SAM-dependent methyltransferase [Serinicoccus kebangsaanensis]